MITISVDEAYAFDFLSILEVKRVYLPNTNSLYELYCREIKAQTEETLFSTILASEDYKELVCINRKIYDNLELLRAGKDVAASIIDNLNSDRYRLKTSIQLTYFNSNVSETKSK